MEVICEAIAALRVISFYYKGGRRTVEPHMVALNRANHLVLSAWFLHGVSESNDGPDWREYLLDDISSVQITNQTFAGPRPGYRPDGGKKYHNIKCRLPTPLR